MAIGWFAVALLLMLVGLLGAALPLVPGLPLVLAGVYVYALATGLGAGIGLGHLVLYTLIGGAAILFGTLANLFGARAAGGSRAGALGAVLGLLVGLVLGGPVGVLIGPFVGAVAFELLAGQAAYLATLYQFGFGDPRFVRLNFGTQRARLEQALERIRSASRPSPRG